MGDLHHLTTGPVSPAVAAIFAGLGCLLGILLVTQARRRTGWRRVRLVAYGILTLALPAVFLPALVTVLALRVDGSVLLLAPIPAGYSLAAATGGTALAVLMLCWGRPGSLRQVLAGLLFMAAIGGTATFLAASLTTGVPIGAEIGPAGVALALTCVTGFGLATALAATRTLRKALGTAALIGLSLAALYHVAAAGLMLRPAVGTALAADEVVGLAPQRVGLPAVVAIAVVVIFTWYFTLGTATVRDLRRMFEPEADVEEIEPWMIEQVSRRVALTSTAYVPVPGWPEVWVRDEPTVAVHAVPVVGRGIASVFAHRARAALPAASVEAETRSDGHDELGEIPADPTHGLAPANGPAPANGFDPAHDAHPTDGSDPVADRSGELGVTHGPGPDEWPARGRNEPPATRLDRPTWLNNRYGSAPADRADEPDPLASVDPEAWATQLRALTSARTAADHDETFAIVHDYRAGSPLPRRNARPINRP